MSKNSNRTILGQYIDLEQKDVPSVSPLLTTHQFILGEQAIVRSQAADITHERIDVRPSHNEILGVIDGLGEPEVWAVDLDVTLPSAEGAAEELGVDARFDPSERSITFTSTLPRGCHVHVHAIDGTGGVLQHEDSLTVAQDVTSVALSVVDGEGRVLSHDVLKTSGEKSELRLSVGNEKLKEEEGELLEIIHSFLEAEERIEKAKEESIEILQENAERELELTKEKFAEELEHSKHPHGEHVHAHQHSEHEHHHEHAPHEHGYSIDATFDPESRQITFFHVMEGIDCTFEILVQSGKGTIERRQGDLHATVSPDVKSVQFVIKNKKGEVVLEGTLPTNGKASALHVKKEGAHHGHEEKHGEAPHGKEEKKSEHPAPKAKDHHAPEESDEIVELQNVLEDEDVSTNSEIDTNVASNEAGEKPMNQNLFYRSMLGIGLGLAAYYRFATRRMKPVER